MPTCEICQSDIKAGEEYEYLGKTLCEDCYLDARNRPKTCDPWATYSATRTAGQGEELTELQQRILDLLAEKGPLPEYAIRDALGLDQKELEREFATLRHMEKARACKQGGQTCLTLFDDPTH